MPKNNRLLFIFIGLFFLMGVTGCVYELKITSNIAKDRLPVDLICCEKYNYNWSFYNESQGHSSCCLDTDSPDKCNTCITEEKARIAEEIRKERQKNIILITSLLILFSLTIISLLLLISNKITSLVKDSPTGFLSPKLKKIITRLFTIVSAATFFFILYIILTSGIIRLGIA